MKNQNNESRYNSSLGIICSGYYVFVVGSQLVYILIGGGINSLRVVKHALEKEIPVLVATVSNL